MSEDKTRDEGALGHEPTQPHGAGPSPSASPSAGSPARGTVVGRYVLLEKIGEGGMGVVFRAHDPELDRDVAVKLLRAGRRSARPRLLREAQALARLSHPSILAIFDVGEALGQLFLATELLEGPTLAEHVAGRRSPEEILARYVEAGRGLAAAHAAGIVHRDFKPNNVLLGKDGRARVVDFGLARPTGEANPSSEDSGGGSSPARSPSHLTHTGSIVGTPGYMAPEQLAAGRVDARTDQFAFCISLWEGLFGRGPFVDAAQHVTLEAAEDTIGKRFELRAAGNTSAGGHKVPPRVRRALVSGLSVDPEDRWPSMEALLAALQPAPRRAAIAAAVLVGIVAAAGAAAAIVAARDEPSCDAAAPPGWDEARRPVVTAAFAATGLSYAPRAAERVTALLSERAHQLTALERQACEATRVRHAESEELFALRRACFDGHRRDLAALADLLAPASGVADAAVVKNAVRVAQSLRDVRECAGERALRMAPPPADPAQLARAAALRTRVAAARTLVEVGKGKDGLTAARAAVVEARALGVRRVLAEALNILASAMVATGDDAAGPTSEEALNVAAAAGDDEAALNAAIRLTGVLGRDGRTDDAIRWGHHAEAILERIGNDAAMAAQRAAQLHLELGSVYYAAQRLDEAQREAQLTLALRVALFGTEHADVGRAQNNVALVLVELGRVAEALPHAEKAAAIMTRELGPDHPETMSVSCNLGYALYANGREDEAIARIRPLVALAEKNDGPDHPTVARMLRWLAWPLASSGRLDEARAGLERAVDILRRRFGDDDGRVGLYRVDLGVVLRKQGRAAEAVAALEEARRVLELHADPHDADVASVLVELAAAHLAAGDAAAARPLVERALAMRGPEQLKLPGVTARLRFTLARALWETRPDRARARELAAQAREGFSAAGPAYRGELADTVAWIEAHR